jgi:putative transposase
MKATLAVAAPRNASARRDPVGAVVRSEGSQFLSNAFVRTIKNNGLGGSIGRVVACEDNAAMEAATAGSPLEALCQTERITGQQSNRLI